MPGVDDHEVLKQDGRRAGDPTREFHCRRPPATKSRRRATAHKRRRLQEKHKRVLRRSPGVLDAYPCRARKLLYFSPAAEPLRFSPKGPCRSLVDADHVQHEIVDGPGILLVQAVTAIRRQKYPVSDDDRAGSTAPGSGVFKRFPPPPTTPWEGSYPDYCNPRRGREIAANPPLRSERIEEMRKQGR